MKNTFEKIIKRVGGTQVKIEIEIHSDTMRDKKITYHPSIWHRGKGKRKWIHVPINPVTPLNKSALEIISEDELLQAKTDFWKTLKP